MSRMDFSEERAHNIGQEERGGVGGGGVFFFPRGSFGLCLTAASAFNYFAFELSEQDPSFLKSILSGEGSSERATLLE